jgi:serine/threonine-protein kinase
MQGMVGRELSRYRIVEEVGAGGMAVVYRGLDTGLDREVAVKVLHPHLASKPESRARFSREAKAVARLKHPHIVEIHDFSGDDAPEAFMVMEYIRGETLRSYAEKHPLKEPPELAAMAVVALADALAHAHAIGIIHRDLKPENIMVGEDGSLKLTDFGIAKILDRDDKMTMTGALVGSPAHMAPEVIDGEEARDTSDIFSLGITLYWLCTGKLPFMAANTTATLKRILDGHFDDARLHNPMVSDGLWEVLQRCLARDPAARYPSATALRDALAAVLREAGIDRPEEELGRFFADPSGTPAALCARIAATLLDQARAHAAAGSVPRAVAALDRVLALQPGSAEAAALLSRLRLRRKRRRQLAWAAALGVGVPLLGAGAWGVKQALTPQEHEGPVARPMPDPVKPVVEPVRVVIPVPAPVEDAGAPAPAADAGPAARPHPGFHLPQHPLVAKAQPLGTVRVVPRPYADITIDNVKVKKDALEHVAELPAGPHTILLEHAHCVPETVKVDIPAGGQAPDVRVRLRPQPARLKVDAASDVGVLVDGKLMGTAGMSQQNPFMIAMPQDTSGQFAYHTDVKVTLTKPGFHDAEVSQRLDAGETATVARALRPE